MTTNAGKDFAAFKETMDHVDTNVFFADADRKLVFANKKALETLGTVAGQIQKAFNVDVNDVAGMSIHKFHSDPAKIEALLSNPANFPRKADLSFEGVVLETNINTVFDDDGEFLGHVVNWEEVGEQRKVQAETKRLQQMVDSSPTACMLADADFNITYMNPVSLKTLKTVEQYLPCPADQIIGKNVDFFHQNPAHQRSILNNPANLPTTADIALGPEKLSLLVTAINDGDGNFVGPMLTWEVVTEKRHAEAETQRLKQMIENSPTACILADADFNITYMNPISLKTLKSVEQYLPCPADQIVGKSVDFFHKNPSYQRGVLSNPANLPVRADIELGPEKLSLLVSSISDANGEFIGPMLTWEVVTEKRMLELEMGGQVSAIQRAMAVIEFELDGTIITANDNFLTTLDYTLDEVKGKHHRMFVEPSFAQTSEYTSFWAALNRGEFQTGEFKRLGKGGKEVWIQASYNPILDNNGTPFKVVKYATDVTGAAVARQEIAKLALAAKAGQLSARADVSKVAGDSAALVESVNEMLDAILLPVQEGARILELVAARDLTQTVTADYEGDHAAIKNSINKVIENVGTALSQIAESADQFAEGSRVVSEGSTSLSDGAQTQSANVEEMSASIQALNQMIEGVAKNAKDANTVAKDTSHRAEEGGAAVTKNIEAMKLIDKSAEQIAEIIGVISEIAAQTNLLALNAAIEAARAGEHGLGFAVVADEVRKLAERSSQAAKEINTLIKESTQRVKEGAELSEQTGAALEKIIEGVAQTANGIGQIAEATNEQAQTASEVSTSIQNVASITENNASAAEEMSGSAEELSGQAMQLKELVGAFKV